MTQGPNSNKMLGSIGSFYCRSSSAFFSGSYSVTMIYLSSAKESWSSTRAALRARGWSNFNLVVVEHKNCRTWWNMPPKQLLWCSFFPNSLKSLGSCQQSFGLGQPAQNVAPGSLRFHIKAPAKGSTPSGSKVPHDGFTHKGSRFKIKVQIKVPPKGSKIS